MSKQYLGLDIGNSAVKMAVCGPDAVHRLAVAELPENMVSGGRILSPASMSEFLRDMRREHHVSCRDAAVILPEDVVFFRQLVVPAMTADQLAINLPYEFRDYISREKDLYFYDYAVVGRTDDENGAPEQFELLAAAVLKETIADYRDMLRRAGLRLRVALPQEMAWSNLLRAYEARHPLGEAEEREREYCILDIGHTSTRLHLFHGRKIEMSKVIEHGCSLVDAAIAETRDIDEHVARTHKVTDHEGAQTLEASLSVYSAIAIEVMKALNFHSYEHRDNRLERVHYCGGGALLAPLIDTIAQAVHLPLAPIGELLPEIGSGAEDVLSCAAAVGAAQQ
ncbi:MAG: pilus assembly protein PilM [Eubacteriales bacterium]|nr:pilus assembly protein PilM [Eubacteriales bacterium]